LQNFIITLTYVHGINLVLDLWNSVYESTLANQPLNSTQIYITRHYLDKLQVTPRCVLGFFAGCPNPSDYRTPTPPP
jgi:hypothetical protein